MKNCAPISGRTVCSDSNFIVFSHTEGILAERNRFEQAKEFWEAELARYAERGHTSDALLFEWSDNQWVMFGNLYDLELERVAQHPPIG